MRLSNKQEAFCLALLDTDSLSDAYRKVYSTAKKTPKTIHEAASRLANNPKIVARLMELRAPALEKANVTVEYIVNNLVELVERCMQKAPVLVRQGSRMVQLKNEKGCDVWQFDSKGANSALATLARYKGMLTDKVEHSGSVTHRTVMDLMLEDDDGREDVPPTD